MTKADQIVNAESFFAQDPFAKEVETATFVKTDGFNLRNRSRDAF